MLIKLRVTHRALHPLSIFHSTTRFEYNFRRKCSILGLRKKCLLGCCPMNDLLATTIPCSTYGKRGQRKWAKRGKLGPYGRGKEPHTGGRPEIKCDCI
ncbi:hypothetical protein EVAR_48349_1 [Eumeta japonica]|uniref:Uncharacterized protein n=1 Tax=Eumeta variegata TaxID=151549 RepID=A0A4C1WIH5_EUMVA|nr:hypothetical protein EVAR_48349_1 [Eumeta japonica]